MSQADWFAANAPKAAPPPPVAPSGAGTWEDKGIAGKVWHPNEGPTNERGRPDNSILGMPPEMALLPAVGISRAVAGGLNLGGKAIAGGKAALSHAAPALKYEATKVALESVGIPAPLATSVAIMVSGYKRSAKPAVKTSGASAPPAVSSPGAPASPAAPSAPAVAPTSPAGPQWSPQRLRNELGLAARRNKVTLTEQEYEVAAGMVQQGVPATDAVKTVAAQLAKPQAAPRLKLNVEEAKVYMRLRGQGKTHQDAQEAIQGLRDLGKGLPSTKTVQTKVAERNATGRWD